MELNQQIKTNAIISYLFLGWIFLLVKNNPNFWNIFVKNHAKNATKIHLFFLVSYLIYSFIIIKSLSTYLYYKIPVIFLNLNQIISFLFFWALICITLYSIYKVNKWEMPNNINTNININIQNELQETNDISETQKIIYLSTYLPFIWLISAKKYNNYLNEYWANIWWFFTSIIILYYVFIWYNFILFIIITFYILIFVFSWVNIFVNNKIIINSIWKKLYNLTEIYIFIKTYFYYFIDFIKLIFWKEKELNFKEILNIVQLKEKEYFENMNKIYVNENIFISKYFICVPLINFIFIPILFFRKNSKYTIAIIQWIIYSIILIIIFNIYWYYSDKQVLILFPVFLLLVNIESNPFYKIPIIFDIWFFIKNLIFFIFNKINFLQNKRKEEKEINYKI